MTTIVIQPMPLLWNLQRVVTTFSKAIGGDFIPLSFRNLKGASAKACYVKLSDKLNPAEVVQRINSMSLKGLKMDAQVVDKIPVFISKQAIRNQAKNELKRVIEESPGKVMDTVRKQLLFAYQLKYPTFMDLDMRTNHELMLEMSRVIANRVKHIMSTSPDTTKSAFMTSKLYHKAYPHDGDFEFIVSSLHKVEDAQGLPRSHLIEEEFSSLKHFINPMGDTPNNKISSASQKYTDKILKAVLAHLVQLDTRLTAQDTDEDIARKIVRRYLKKMTSCVPSIVREVVRKYFAPAEQNIKKIRLYGEPFLPQKHVLAPFLQRFGAHKIYRAPFMHNMLMFRVMPTHYTSLLAADGTNIGGAKLVIRPVSLLQRTLRLSKVESMNVGAAEVMDEVEDDEQDEEEDYEFTEDL